MKATRPLVAVSVLCLVVGCAPVRTDGGTPEHGFDAAGIGIGYLILSPILIAAGLLEGIVSLPYFIAADLHALNRGMVEAQARVNLEETYQYAYDEPLAGVPEDGDTGRVFRHLRDATRHFQKVLKGYGVEDYDRYVLTAVRTADREGYTLYAVVHRPAEVIRIVDRHDGGTVRVLRPGDRRYYEPHLRGANGRLLDVVIDWAGVPRTSIKTQKGQAILMTIAANSVLINRRSDDYWDAEQRWLAGDYLDIVAERRAYLDQRMGLAG